MTPACQALAPDEHEQASQAMASIKATYQQLTLLDHQQDVCALDLGKMLAEFFDKNWCRSFAGMTTEQWVQTHLRHGKKFMTIDQANSLARDWRVIHEFEKVEQAVRAGLQSRTSAFYACSTIKLMGCPGNDLAAFGLLAAKTGKELRSEYYALKKDKPDTESEWVPISGAVPAQVKKDMVDVLDELKDLAREDGPSAADRTLTWQIERLAGFGRDALDAIKAHIAGDDRPLQALVETVRAGR